MRAGFVELLLHMAEGATLNVSTRSATLRISLAPRHKSAAPPVAAQRLGNARTTAK